MAATAPGTLTISPAVDQLTRRLAVHIEAGRYAIALRVLADAVEEMTRQQEARVRGHSGDLPIASIGLPVRSTNALEAAGILTVADVRIRTDGELLAIKGFGSRTLRDVRRVTRTA